MNNVIELYCEQFAKVSDANQLHCFLLPVIWFIFSHVEQHGRVLSEVQLPTVSIKEEDQSDNSCDAVKTSPPSRNRPVSNKPSRRREVKVADIFHVPTFSTEDVFGDLNEDMDDDYYFPPGGKKSEYFNGCCLYSIVYSRYLIFTCSIFVVFGTCYDFWKSHLLLYLSSVNMLMAVIDLFKKFFWHW